MEIETTRGGAGGEEGASKTSSEEIADLERRLRDSETLLEIGVALAGTLDLARVLELALRQAEDLCRAETSSIWELDDDSGELFFRVVRGKAAGSIRGLRVPLGEGIVGDVALSGEPAIVNDVHADPRWHGDSSTGFETRAILAVPLSSRGRVIGVLQVLNPVEGSRFTDEDSRRMRLFAGPVATAIENARLYAAQKRQFVETVTALAESIEKRDPYTGNHVRRVVCYSVLLGTEMGLDDEALEHLQLAATLHDVGKIATPDEVLRKPSPLSEEEKEVMRRHPIDGEEIVSRIRDLRGVLPGIRSHHERLDGLGYPDGLRDREIPLEPRIIAVADTFDAMTTERPYRKSMAPSIAAQEIAAGVGTQFCPQVVAAFLQLYDRGEFTLQAGEEVIQSLSRNGRRR
ncbi:MAG TPA: HD domain-containing phosphohydrolase [Thermoanaerobaculia bacterium]|nr:HD domain-containing phosphohydrolase [Thermoanaerobaculia bacterium]